MDLQVDRCGRRSQVSRDEVERRLEDERGSPVALRQRRRRRIANLLRERRPRVEAALADALGKAAAAGRFDVVAVLARELESRRLASTPNVLELPSKAGRRT